MSSFIINKAEFIKCAGALAAVNGKPSQDWDIYDKFKKAYVCNVCSVGNQYHEEFPLDHNDYMDLFREYKDFAATRDRHEVLAWVLSFIQSVMYQIEDDEFYESASCSLYSLYHSVLVGDYKCWGSFDYKESVTREQSGQ